MYKIDLEVFKDRYIDKKPKANTIPFKHIPNALIKDLPFVTNNKDMVLDFTGVMGGYVRLLTEKELKEKVEYSAVIEAIKEIVECSGGERDAYQLERIIKEIYFDEQNELVIFSNKAMLYTNAEANERKMAKFLFDVLNVQSEDQTANDYFNQEADNVLDELMYEALPELEKKKNKEQIYTPLMPYVSQMFVEDFKYICGDQELFKRYIKRLLDYYYFFYVSQMSLKLDQMFNAKLDEVEPLFFSVDWEKLSKSRQAYNYGWKKLEPYTRKLFSHSKLLEMLNQDGRESHLPNENLDYIKIRENLNEIMQTSYPEDIKSIIEIYKENVNDYDFTAVAYKEIYENELLNDIHYLFECINSQCQANRPEVANKYSNRFVEYCKYNFLKNRRSLSHTLNLTEEDIIFLTKICIKDQEKMKLQDLFSEFERRGIKLDQKTRDEINGYYEKLNLIEKKSDSGDAQYVKGIL